MNLKDFLINSSHMKDCIYNRAQSLIDIKRNQDKIIDRWKFYYESFSVLNSYITLIYNDCDNNYDEIGMHIDDFCSNDFQSVLDAYRQKILKEREDEAETSEYELYKKLKEKYGEKCK